MLNPYPKNKNGASPILGMTVTYIAKDTTKLFINFWIGQAMKTQTKRLALAIASAGLLTLYGCGGGALAPVTPSPPVATTADVGITVVDGPIKNATVCLDKNNNGLCDPGEPTDKTDASGKVTLKVDLADVGKYPVLAVVGTDAVDSDTGAVPIPFTLKAPADKTGVISPLTTLVQRIIDTTGVSSAVAASQVQAQTGINVSVFEDFSKSSSAYNAAAATIARMLVVTTQQQSSLLDSSVGSSALDGAKITKADLDTIIQNKLLEILPALLAALSDPAVLNATTPAARETALLAQATTLVNSASTGLTTASVATLAAVNSQIAATTSVVADAPSAGGNLRLLNFTNTGNFAARINVATLAQATPDASGITRFVQRRYSANNGSVAAWTTIGGSPSRQSDMHFNGSAWVSCALNIPDTSTVRDAKGNASYNICDNSETGSSNRASFDISGRTMLDVYNQINAAGYTNITVASPTTTLGSATFPANSKLFYQVSTSQTSAPTYYPGTGNYVTQYSRAVSDGGTASTQAPGVGCNSVEFQGVGADSTTLESMVSAMTGTPCVFNTPTSFTYNGLVYTSPDAGNDAWGNSTVSIGTLGNAPTGTGATAPGFYSGNIKFRVAFKGAGVNPVTYYACKERFNNGSTRSCADIGSGSYTIATKGDARIMTLNNLPLQTAGLGLQRVFVERGGKIYFGYQNNLGVFNSVRLNLPATNALFAKLGLPAVDVDTPLALTQSSYTGEYRVANPNDPGAYNSLFVNANGSITSSYTNSTGTTPNNNVVSFTNPATGAFSGSNATSGSTFSGTVNFITGAFAISGTDPSATPPAFSLTGARR